MAARQKYSEFRQAETNPEAADKMRLDSAMRQHLVSTYSLVRHLIRQLEEATTEGRSPTGVGSPLSPLSDEHAQAILTPLRSLAAVHFI